MHTIIVIAIGLVLLGLCALVGRMFGGASGAATATLVFLPLWLVGAGINMFIGVKRAGYSVAADTDLRNCLRCPGCGSALRMDQAALTGYRCRALQIRLCTRLRRLR